MITFYKYNMTMTMTIASIIECSLSIFQVPPFAPSVESLNERPITTFHIPKANYPIRSCLLYYIYELIYYTTMYIQCIYIFINFTSPTSLDNLTTNRCSLPLLRLLLHQFLPAHPPRRSTNNLQDTFQLLLIPRRIDHDEPRRHGPQITPPPALPR